MLSHEAATDQIVCRRFAADLYADFLPGADAPGNESVAPSALAENGVPSPPQQASVHAGRVHHPAPPFRLRATRYAVTGRASP